MQNFVTPPPAMNYTIDPEGLGMSAMNSFGAFSEEPDTDKIPKRHLNLLKESISKLSTDFNRDRLFFQNMIKSASKQSKQQFFPNNSFIKSYDGVGGEEMLPSINGNPNKRLPVKSPVMESIRMSRQNRNKNFMSVSRGRADSQESLSSNSDKSIMSKATNMRKSYYSKRNNPKNVSMNKGTFFVHKKDSTSKPAERNQNIIRASTILNSSMFGNALRNSKMIPKKSFAIEKEVEVSTSKNNLRLMKRKSKTFIEKDMFKNKLANRQPEKGLILNPWIESKESPDFDYYEDEDDNPQISQKTIAMMQGKL